MNAEGGLQQIVVEGATRGTEDEKREGTRSNSNGQAPLDKRKEHVGGQQVPSRHLRDRSSAGSLLDKPNGFRQAGSDAGSDRTSQRASEAAKSPRSSKGKVEKSAGKKRKSKDKKRLVAKGEEFELDGLNDDDNRKRKRFYLRRNFWTFWMPLLWTLVLGFTGVMLRIFSPLQSTGDHFQLWRLFLFLAGLPIIALAARYILLGMVWFLESQFFTTTNVLYFAIALKSPLRYVIMSLLLLPLYIPLFSPQAQLSHGANTVYHRILDFIASVIVFCAANFFKVLFAKVLASYFHTSTHFSKMQDALDKEYYLQVLATPRQEGAFVDMLAPEDGKPKDDEQRRLDRRNSVVGRNTPARFMQKMVEPLKKAATVNPLKPRQRASSLPSPATLDSLATEHTAQQDHRGNSLPSPQPPPIATQPPPSAPSASNSTPSAPPSVAAGGTLAGRQHRQEGAFESPGHGPHSPKLSTDAVQMVERETARLSQASAPLPSALARSDTSRPRHAAGSLRFENDLLQPPADVGNVPLSQRLSLPTGNNAALGQLQRRNSDGGAGVAGILTDMASEGKQGGDKAAVVGLAQLERNSPGGERSRDSRTSHQGDATEGRSSRRLSRQDNMSPWARKRLSERAAPISEGREEDSDENPAKLPALGEEMTNEEGQRLVATITQVEKHLRKRQMAVPFMSQLGSKSSTVPSEGEARKLAFFIFWNIKPFFDRNYILPVDLEDFLSPSRAAEAFQVLDVDGDGQLTLPNLREAVTNILNERTDLAMQLKDTKNVVSRLELVIGVVLHLACLVIYLIIFGVDIQKVWALFASVVLAFAFIFGNSIKNLFEAVVFLFVTNAFDVGDYLLLDGFGGTQDRVRVEEISLTTIVARRVDGLRMFVPTTKLVQATCQNLSRSDKRSEGFKFLVDLGTPASVLTALDQAIGKHIEAHENDFSSGHSVQLISCSDPLKVALNIGFEFAHNAIDGAKTGQARSDLLQLVSDTLVELGVINSQAPMRPFNDPHPLGVYGLEHV